MDKYDDTYQAVVNMAKCKMIMNKHKGDIEDCLTDELMEAAKGEVDELRNALSDPNNYMNIIEECADVLNFMVAAAHKTIEAYRDRKPTLKDAITYREALDAIQGSTRKAP